MKMEPIKLVRGEGAYNHGFWEEWYLDYYAAHEHDDPRPLYLCTDELRKLGQIGPETTSILVEVLPMDDLTGPLLVEAASIPFNVRVNGRLINIDGSVARFLEGKLPCRVRITPEG